MTTKLHLPIVSLLVLVVLLPLAGRGEDGPSPTETRLRDALKSTMLQMRDTQNQIVTLQEAQTESDKEKTDLQAKVDALTAQLKTTTDQAAADKAEAQQKIADQKQNTQDLVVGMVDALSTQINLLGKAGADDKTPLLKTVGDMKIKNPDLSKAFDQYVTDIQLWKMGYYQYVQFATTTEAAREKLAVQSVMLQRLVADRETKNLELYKTGTEILDRYEKFSFGDALSAKEPFVGTARVKLQELVQDYKDKLLAGKLNAGQPMSAPGGASAPASNGAVTEAKP